MKKSFLPLAFILASCSDMVSSEEEIIAGSLPDGFSVEQYIEINPDVKISQIALDIKNKNLKTSQATPIGSSRRVALCQSFLSDAELFEDIYLNYLNCPKRGWNPEQKCNFPVNNVNYNKENSCNIRGCWSGGWDTPYCQEYADIFECEDALGPGHYCCSSKEADQYDIKPLKNNQGKVSNLKSLSVPSSTAKGSPSIDTTFWSMCAFNLYPEDGVFDLSKVKAYLKNFKYDATLMAKHFLLAGRYEGRAYRYCNNDTDAVRSQDMANYVSVEKGYLWDYSINIKTSKPQFFCLNKSDGKVYRIK